MLNSSELSDSNVLGNAQEEDYELQESVQSSERYDTIVGNSLGGTKMSRVTVLTDKWRALNADIFDMKTVKA